MNPKHTSIKLLLPIAIGIWLWWYLDDLWSLPIYLLLLFAPFFYYYYHTSIQKIFFKNIFGITSTAILLWAGYQMTAYRSNDIIVTNNDNGQNIIATVIDSDINRKFQRALIRIDEFENQGQAEFPKRAFANFKLSDNLLNIGDEVALTGKLFGIRPPKNPGGFDFQAFAKGQNVYHQIYPDRWEKLSSSMIHTSFKNIKDDFQQKLNHFAPTYSYISSAIILGDKSALTDEVSEKFKVAGLMHLMVVSGLHAGIFFSMAWYLFTWLIPLFRFKKILVAIIAIISTWIFIGISGFHPSACRAGIMISIYCLGRLFQKHTNALNVLGATALFMLILDPFQIFQLSFQFSFLAMLGILVIFPILRKKFNNFNNVILKRIVDASLLTLSAQLTLAPCILFYFGEFPTYFLLGSVLSLPLVPLIMYSGIAIAIFGYFSTSIASWLGIVHEYLISYLLVVIKQINGLPANILEVFHFSSIHLSLIFIMIGIGVWVLHKCSQLNIMALFGFGIFCLGIASWISPFENSQGKLTIYHTKNKLVMDFFDRNNCYQFGDLNQQDENISKLINGWRTKHLLTNSTKLNEKSCLDIICRNQEFIMFFDKVIWIIESIPTKWPNLDQIDYLIINSKDIKDLELIERNICVNKIILPHHLGYYQRKNLKNSCMALGIECYDISLKGAFVKSLNFKLS